MNQRSPNSLQEKRKRVKWPVWLPYPSSWARMLGLALPVCCTGLVPIVSLEVWRFLFVFIVAWIGDHPEPLFGFLFVLGFLVASFILYLVIILIYAKLSYLFLRIFWSNPPKWTGYLRPCKNLGEILWGFGVTTLAASIAFIPFIGFSFSRDLVSESFVQGMALKKGMGESEAIGLYAALVFQFWFISAAYLYQFEYLFRQSRIRRGQARIKNQRKPHRLSQVEPPDPIDIELSRLRGDLGLHQIKRETKIATKPRSLRRSGRSQKRILKLGKVRRRDFYGSPSQ